jgi:hypothetical protein
MKLARLMILPASLCMVSLLTIGALLSVTPKPAAAQAQAPAERQITSYQVGWNPGTNQGVLTLHLQNTLQPVTLQVKTVEQLNVLIAILGHGPVAYRQDGTVFSGSIPAGR